MPEWLSVILMVVITLTMVIGGPIWIIIRLRKCATSFSDGYKEGKRNALKREGLSEVQIDARMEHESVWSFIARNRGPVYTTFILIGTIIGIVVPLAWPVLILFWYRAYKGWQSFREETDLQRTNSHAG